MTDSEANQEENGSYFQEQLIRILATGAKPKSPLSAFCFFSTMMRKRISLLNPRMSQAQVYKEVSKQWRTCTERETYQEIARQNYQDYRRLLEIRRERNIGDGAGQSYPGRCIEGESLPPADLPQPKSSPSVLPILSSSTPCSSVSAEQGKFRPEEGNSPESEDADHSAEDALRTDSSACHSDQREFQFAKQPQTNYYKTSETVPPAMPLVATIQSEVPTSEQNAALPLDKQIQPQEAVPQKQRECEDEKDWDSSRSIWTSSDELEQANLPCQPYFGKQSSSSASQQSTAFTKIRPTSLKVVIHLTKD